MAASPPPWNWNRALTPSVVLLLLPLVGLLVWAYFYPLQRWEAMWRRSPAWNHGYLIPAIAVLIAHYRLKEWPPVRILPSAWGLVPIVAGFAVRIWAMTLKFEYPGEVSFLLVVAGMVLLVLGWEMLRVLWVPIVYLGLMIPWTAKYYDALALPLQWLAAVGAENTLRLFGMAIAREGNVLRPFGSPLVGVAGACSGLHLLFTFVALGVMMAYIYRRPLWERLMIIGSSVPIAVLCNVVRVVLMTAAGHAIFNEGKAEAAGGPTWSAHLPDSLWGLLSSGAAPLRSPEWEKFLPPDLWNRFFTGSALGENLSRLYEGVMNPESYLHMSFGFAMLGLAFGLMWAELKVVDVVLVEDNKPSSRRRSRRPAFFRWIQVGSGVGLCLGFAVGVLLFLRGAATEGGTGGSALAVFLWLLVGGVAGGGLGLLAFHWARGGGAVDRWVRRLAEQGGRRIGALAAALLLAVAVAVGIAWTLSEQAGLGALQSEQAQEQLRRNIIFDWTGVGMAAIGAGLFAVIGTCRRREGYLHAAGIVPVAYVVLVAAPQAASLEAWPILRLVVALAAAVSYLPVVLPLVGRLQYAVGCGVLAVGAGFFTFWEPPPPTPVPIAKPLAALEPNLLREINDVWREKKLPGTWTGNKRALPEDIETMLGVDDYLNLDLALSGSEYRVLVFITYNANAMSNVPHVPWVCMTQSGFKLVSIRQDEVTIRDIPGLEIQPNVILFEGSEGRGKVRALMFQYFNVGHNYTWSREIARILATTGSLGHAGSYLSQTQVAIWLPPGDKEDPMAKNSAAYRMGLEFLNVLVPLLEREHYPNLGHGATPIARGVEGG